MAAPPSGPGQLGAGAGAEHRPSLCLPGVSPALAETVSGTGFPHLPRVCFLLAFNMFHRSLVRVPKIIKPARSIKTTHTQHAALPRWLWFVKFFVTTFSVKSRGRNEKLLFPGTAGTEGAQRVRAWPSACSAVPVSDVHGRCGCPQEDRSVFDVQAPAALGGRLSWV